MFLAWLIWPGGAGSSQASDIGWDRLADGLDIANWEPRQTCSDAVPATVLLRIDPERYRFAVYHYLDEKLSAPLTIKEWHRRTGALILFNAGLFREDYTYLGLLFKDGRALESHRHRQWHGLFAAEPVDATLPRARVMDLAVERFSTDHPAYREAAQSLMLLDRAGKPRVNQTGKRAHQTIVAELDAGQILVAKTSGAAALWELATCLRKSVGGVRQAMAMDGGASSDLLVSEESVQPAEEGTEAAPYQLPAIVDGTGMGHIPLPSVIGVLPR